MTRKNRARYGLSRTYKVSATAKALRGAMIAALATAGVSQGALAADECIKLGQNVQCVGATGDTIDNFEIESPDSPFDLTTVTFATSFNSVVLNWNGVDISVGGNDDLRVNNLGSIVVVDDENDAGDIGWTLYGVRADAVDGGISFNNSDSGTVLVDIDTNNGWWWYGNWISESNGAAVGVDLYGEDFATVTNAGLISAGNSTWDSNGWSDATALRVDSRGDVTVVNQAFGSIYAYSADGDAIAVDLWSDNGDVTLVNNANIAATGDDWTVGVLAEADADISVNNNFGAEIRVYSEFGDATGVLARAWNDGNITIENAGLVQAIGDNWATGVYAETIGGDIAVGNTGDINVRAYDNDATGIYAETIGGDIAVGNTGDINVRAYDNDATGIGAETKYGAVNIQNGTDARIDVWGYAQASGVTVASISGYGDVTVGNTGTISVLQESNYSNNNNGPFGLFGDATGIGVFHGIAGFYMGPNPFTGYGDVSVANSGLVGVRADGGDATGVGVVSFGGDVSISNAGYGVINVVSEDNNATGIGAAAIFADVTITNDGLVNAESYGWNWDYGDAVGIAAGADFGSVDVNNSGEIQAYSWGEDATGIRAYASGFDGMMPNIQAVGLPVGLMAGDIRIVNSGMVGVYAQDDATGIYTLSENGVTSIGNTGVIDVDSDRYSATGIRAVSRGGYNGDITIDNAAVLNSYGSLVGGIIDVYSSSWGWASPYSTDAVGIDARSEGYGDIAVTNSGLVAVGSELGNNGDAWGVRAVADNNFSNYGGSITVSNSGLIDVYAGDRSWGVRADTFGDNGDITVTNSGRIISDSDSDDAFAIDLATRYEADISVTNSGTLKAYGDDDATGIDGSNNGYGDLTVTNSGFIGAYAYNADAYGMELSVGANSGDYQLAVTNTGVVFAGSDYGDAYGVRAESDSDGDISITNAAVYSELGVLVGGIISATSEYYDAYGVRAYHYGNGDIVVGNSGLISAVADDESGLAIGVDMHHYGAGDIRLTNSGDIHAYSDFGEAWGIHADTDQGTGDIDIANSGFVFARSDDNDTVGVLIDGNGNITVRNTGIIQAIGNSDAYGVEIDSRNNGSVGLVNYAESVINVGSFFGQATGVDVSVVMDGHSNDGASASVTNAGFISVNGYGDAVGVSVSVDEGSYYVDTQGHTCSNNLGCVGLNGYVANGGWVVDQNGYWHDGVGSAPVTVSNSGDITVTSGNGYAEGIFVDMRNGVEGELASVTNSGIIDVLTEDGFLAWGVHVDNRYGDISVINTATGNILAANESEPYYLAEGGYAVGIRTFSDYGDTVISNAGNISVGNSPWRSNGIRAENKYGDVTVSNLAGSTITVNTGGFDAYGVEVDNKYGDVTVSHFGSMTVGGGAWNNKGIEVANDYGDTIINTSAGSRITVVGDGDEVTGGILAYSMDGGITITAAGSIGVTADGFEGYAVGIYGDSDNGDITVTNSAAVTANANGDYGDAVGIAAFTNSGDISVSNSGNVRANANAAYYGWSIGIYTGNDTGATTIANSGNVRATSDGVNDAWAIYHGGNSVAITNSANGNIFGIIRTDDAADSFTNSGDWYATEGNSYVSDFGAGNDSIVNNTGARIFMNDSVIDLGYAEGGVNSFMNNGKVFVSGADNEIDMGGATSVFTNNGASLHFEDGAANDALTIFGDFAGTGHIVVDANGTSMLADRLYIDGDVISNTANVVDVYLTRNPTLEQITDGVEIDIVRVTGTSVAANFNLGIVDVDAEDTLYTVSHTLNKHINVSGSNDLFALGFEISGLSQSGVAVSSIAPAVQNLWHLGSGTMFQRQGSAGGNATATGSAVKGFLNAADGGQVADYQGASGAWVRMFADNGGLTPDMGRDNFGTGGVQQFDLNSSGIEFGAGYAFNDQWTAGLLGGMSEASLKPEVGGRTKVDADTVGAYLTYTPGNGFYLDLTYRAMGFDGQGNGNGFRFEGDADGYSVELGYGFKTDGGLVIEPQFQYSAMDVNLDQVDYFDGDFELTDGNSSQMRGSIALRKTFQSGAGEWTPFASVGVVNETNASNDYIIGGILTGNVDTSGNSTLVEAGATAHYGNMVFSGGVNWKDGGAYDSLFGGQVSVRFTW